MHARPSRFLMPPEWQDPRPALPWGRWLAGLALVSLLVMLAMSLGKRLLAPVPPPPQSPAASLTRQLSRLVEEGRGAESLYVMLESISDRRALQGTQTAQRTRLSELIGTAQASANHAAEQQLIAEFGEALLAWWAVQDQVFEILQSPVITRDDSNRARRLLAEDSQRCFHRVRSIVDRWVAWHKHQAS